MKWVAAAATLQSNVVAVTKTSHAKATICARTPLRVGFDWTQTRGGGRVAIDSYENCAATMSFELLVELSVH